MGGDCGSLGEILQNNELWHIMLTTCGDGICLEYLSWISGRHLGVAGTGFFGSVLYLDLDMSIKYL